MRRRIVGTGAIALAIVLGTAGQAQADIDQIFIDTTSDSAALNACVTATPGDCSIHGAFANANDGDLNQETDTVTFDAQIFYGSEAVPNEGTIVMAGSGVTSTENLVLQALGCFPDPCAAIDGPPGGIAISATNGAFSMNGVAIHGSGSTGLFYGNGGDGMSLNRNWFGLTLNGAPSGNGTGLFIAGPAADVGLADGPENVFAANTVGISIFGNAAADIDVLNNIFGALPDGDTITPNTAADIYIAGNEFNQAPSNVRIGPSAGNDTQACDEGCNVLAAAGMGATPGVNLRGTLVPDHTSTASNITIQNNHIGVNGAGTASLGAESGDLIAVGAADDVTVSGNWMAGGVHAVDAGSGADDVIIEANRIGANAAGTAVLDGTSDSSIAVSSNFTNPTAIITNTIAADAVIDTVAVQGTSAEIASNQIGLDGVPNSGGFTGLLVAGNSHTIQGNSIGNTSGNAITLSDVNGTEIKDNQVGQLGPVVGSGIYLTTDVSNSTGNAIGSHAPDLANEFTDIGNDAIRIQGDGQDGNQLLAATGEADGLFIDLEGDDGPGNGASGPNGGTEAPKVKKVTEKTVSGTVPGNPNGQVWVYRSTSPKGDFPQGLKKLLGTKDVKPDGTWKFKPGGTIKKSWVLTALHMDDANNGSELAKGKARKK